MKLEISKMIKQTLKSRILGVRIDSNTQQTLEPIDAELQVAKLKQLIGIEMFMGFYRDFLTTLSNVYFFQYDEKNDFETNDIITNIHNLLKTQLMAYYEYYYEKLEIEHNIRMNVTNGEIN